LIRKIDTSSSPVAGKDQTYKRGDVVEARFGGGAKWFGGVINKVNPDGTYAIEYEDGDREPKVPAGLIRKIDTNMNKNNAGAGTATAQAPATLAENASSASLLGSPSSESLDVLSPSPSTEQVLEEITVGSHVEGRYAGSKEWCGATVTKATRVGEKMQYSLKYDDGDEEDEVHRTKLRFAGQRQRRSLSVGDEVDAVCKSRKGEVIPGVVAKVKEGDRYVIAFNLLDLGLGKANGVEEELDRKSIYGLHFTAPSDVSAAMSSSPVAGKDQTYKRGDVVEARFGGGAKWFGGVINKVNPDGTYAIEYEDGDREPKVPAALIR
jgi:hypothetical protein